MSLSNFDEHGKHEGALIKRWTTAKKRRMSFRRRLELLRRNAHVQCDKRHLDRKCRAIYPRGKAFDRMVERELDRKLDRELGLTHGS